MKGFRGGAGALRVRIAFHKRPASEVQNAIGASTDVWPWSFDCGAAYEPLGGSEFPIAEKRHEQTTVRFRIRYRPGIDPALYRIGYIFDVNVSPLRTQFYDIHQVTPVGGDKIELEIEASEIR